MVDTQAMTLRLPADIYEQLRRIAFDRKTSMNALITGAVTEWLRTDTQ